MRKFGRIKRVAISQHKTTVCSCPDCGNQKNGLLTRLRRDFMKCEICGAQFCPETGYVWRGENK